MDDLISRQAVLDKAYAYGNGLEPDGFCVDVEDIQALPSAQPERKTGKWILVKGSNGKDYHKCSECLHEQEITGVKNFCAVCGADMSGVEDDNN